MASKFANLPMNHATDDNEKDFEPPPSWGEMAREAVLSRLRAKIDAISHNSDVHFAKAGLMIANGRSRSEVAAREVLTDWKSLAEQLRLQLAERTAEARRLNEEMIGHQSAIQSLHESYYFEVQELQTILDESHNENSTISDRMANIKKRLDEERTAYEAKLAEHTEVSLTLNKQQIKINQKVFSDKPTLREAGFAYLAEREKNSAISVKELAYLKHRLNAFIDIVGDRAIDEYRLRDLSEFAGALRYLPANHSVKPKWRNKTILDAIETNKKLGSQHRAPGLTAKTIKVNYVGKIKTIFSYICADNGISNPFRDSAPMLPAVDQQSVKRKSLPAESVNLLFRHVAKSDRPDEAFLPILGALTGARISELVFLQSKDIRDVFGQGHYVADLISPIKTDDGFIRRPTKNDRSSLRYVALHDKFKEIGFIDWAMSRKGWLFPELHETAAGPIQRPGDTASKRFQRIFRHLGIHQARAEVFHSLRHFYKDWVRDQDIAERTIDIQTGHAMLTVGRSYGSHTLRPEEVRKLTTCPLPRGLDFSAYDDACQNGSWRFAELPNSAPLSRGRKRKVPNRGSRGGVSSCPTT